MFNLRKFLSPIKASAFSIPSPFSPSSFSINLFCGRYRQLKILPRHFYPESEAHILAFGRVMQKKPLHSSNLSAKPSGRKLFVGGFLGFSVAAGLIHQQKNDIYAMDDNYDDIDDPSGFLKDDINAFWSLARKFQLPIVLLVTILLGWRHPFALAINVALLLFSTRPNPFSIYMFVEQLRQRDMRRDPSLQKTKFLYAKIVQVEDYKILCLARVELRDLRMEVIGILGGWWVINTTPTYRV